jgi:DNA-binding CsgD family transcriptional regulator
MRIESHLHKHPAQTIIDQASTKNPGIIVIECLPGFKVSEQLDHWCAQKAQSSQKINRLHFKNIEKPSEIQLWLKAPSTVFIAENLHQSSHALIYFLIQEFINKQQTLKNKISLIITSEQNLEEVLVTFFNQIPITWLDERDFGYDTIHSLSWLLQKNAIEAKMLFFNFKHIHPDILFWPSLLEIAYEHKENRHQENFLNQCMILLAQRNLAPTNPLLSNNGIPTWIDIWDKSEFKNQELLNLLYKQRILMPYAEQTNQLIWRLASLKHLVKNQNSTETVLINSQHIKNKFLKMALERQDNQVLTLLNQHFDALFTTDDNFKIILEKISSVAWSTHVSLLNKMVLKALAIHHKSFLAFLIPLVIKHSALKIQSFDEWIKSQNHENFDKTPLELQCYQLTLAASLNRPYPSLLKLAESSLENCYNQKAWVEYFMLYWLIIKMKKLMGQSLSECTRLNQLKKKLDHKQILSPILETACQLFEAMLFLEKGQTKQAIRILPHFDDLQLLKSKTYPELIDYEWMVCQMLISVQEKKTTGHWLELLYTTAPKLYKPLLHLVGDPSWWDFKLNNHSNPVNHAHPIWIDYVSAKQTSEPVARLKLLKQGLHSASQNQIWLAQTLYALLIQKETHPIETENIYKLLTLCLEQGSCFSLLEWIPDILSQLDEAKLPHTTDEAISHLIQQAKQKFSPSQDNKVKTLSKRELEILELMAQGMTNEEIAEEVYRSVGTIKIHAHNIYKKLEVSNRVEARIALDKYKDMNLDRG